MLQNAYFLAKIGADTAENEPCQVCRRALEEAKDLLRGEEPPLARGGLEVRREEPGHLTKNSFKKFPGSVNIYQFRKFNKK